MNPRRRSTMVVASGTALFAAAVLTGCGSDPDPDYQGVCVDKTTQTRVEDDECDENKHHGGGYGFLLWGLGRSIPPMGGRVSNYPGSVSTLPKGHAAAIGGADRSGGTVTAGSTKSAVKRGGFGSTSRSGWSVGG